MLGYLCFVAGWCELPLCLGGGWLLDGLFINSVVGADMCSLLLVGCYCSRLLLVWLDVFLVCGVWRCDFACGWYCCLLLLLLVLFGFLCF